MTFGTSKTVDGRAGVIEGGGEGREEAELDEVEGAPAVEGGGGGGGGANELDGWPGLSACFFLTVRGTNIQLEKKEKGRRRSDDGSQRAQR